MATNIKKTKNYLGSVNSRLRRLKSLFRRQVIGLDQTLERTDGGDPIVSVGRKARAAQDGTSIADTLVSGLAGRAGRALGSTLGGGSGSVSEGQMMGDLASMVLRGLRRNL